MKDEKNKPTDVVESTTVEYRSLSVKFQSEAFCVEVELYANQLFYSTDDCLVILAPQSYPHDA